MVMQFDFFFCGKGNGTKYLPGCLKAKERKGKQTNETSSSQQEKPIQIQQYRVQCALAAAN